jgi:hypothetical protein
VADGEFFGEVERRLEFSGLGRSLLFLVSAGP